MFQYFEIGKTLIGPLKSTKEIKEIEEDLEEIKDNNNKTVHVFEISRHNVTLVQGNIIGKCFILDLHCFPLKVIVGSLETLEVVFTIGSSRNFFFRSLGQQTSQMCLHFTSRENTSHIYLSCLLDIFS